MGSKTLTYLFLAIRSFLGGWVPTLWGASAFGLTLVPGGLIGGIVGIWAGFKIGQLVSG